uniref:Uncharacterized protein n=1 Tax=Physcomitrium patens TaxID=3218 RepID=A0A2K1JMJ5_PHYPA|nr:hypothetical protein PHYPA_017579 [Physcomitrium patens]
MYYVSIISGPNWNPAPASAQEGGEAIPEREKEKRRRRSRRRSRNPKKKPEQDHRGWVGGCLHRYGDTAVVLRNYISSSFIKPTHVGCSFCIRISHFFFLIFNFYFLLLSSVRASSDL